MKIYIDEWNVKAGGLREGHRYWCPPVLWTCDGLAPVALTLPAGCPSSPPPAPRRSRLPTAAPCAGAARHREEAVQAVLQRSPHFRVVVVVECRCAYRTLESVLEMQLLEATAKEDDRLHGGHPKQRNAAEYVG